MNSSFKKPTSQNDSPRFTVILLGIICALLVILVVREISHRNSSTISLVSLTDPSRKFYKADDLIINIQPLRDELSLLEKDPNISVYFEALNTGANISINKDAEFFPASLLKIPLILSVAKKIERGEWQWSTKLELTDKDKNKDFGTLWQQPTGTFFSLDDLAKYMIVDSDNTAYFMLLNNLDPEEIAHTQNYLGMYDFISNDLEISARRYAPILRSLFSATYLTIEDSEKILNLMTESSFNDFLTSGLPPTVKFAHKIGTEDDRKVYLDAGIVYLPYRPYMLIVMVKNYNEKMAAGIMHDISQKTYYYMLNYPKNL